MERSVAIGYKKEKANEAIDYLDFDLDFLGERERDLLLDLECPRDLERLRLLLPDLQYSKHSLLTWLE